MAQGSGGLGGGTIEDRGEGTFRGGTTQASGMGRKISPRARTDRTGEIISTFGAGWVFSVHRQAAITDMQGQTSNTRRKEKFRGEEAMNSMVEKIVKSHRTSVKGGRGGLQFKGVGEWLDVGQPIARSQ